MAVEQPPNKIANDQLTVSHLQKALGSTSQPLLKQMTVAHLATPIGAQGNSTSTPPTPPANQTSQPTSKSK